MGVWLGCLLSGSSRDAELLMHLGTDRAGSQCLHYEASDGCLITEAVMNAR